ncbi:hypothetical protein N8878_00355 [Psychromonas sp.]|nr:hypothetical protein [Psychromonas sp.]
MNNINKRHHILGKSRQKGMALVIALIILPLLLVLGVLLMNNAFLGLKVIDSRAMQGESNIILNGTASDIMNTPGSAKAFAEATENTTFDSLQYPEANSSVQLLGEINCRRRMDASGSVFKCKYLQVDFKHAYGREKNDGSKWAQNVLSVGVEQPIIVE